MANAMTGLQSAPFAGLGTASLQVVSAGLYSMEFKSFLPHISYGDAPLKRPACSRGSDSHNCS